MMGRPGRIVPGQSLPGALSLDHDLSDDARIAAGAVVT
jgi:hypothetical protein